MKEVSCPFCHEEGFDLIGLKNHFDNNCPKKDEIETIEEEHRRRCSEIAEEQRNHNNNLGRIT